MEDYDTGWGGGGREAIGQRDSSGGQYRKRKKIIGVEYLGGVFMC